MLIPIASVVANVAASVAALATVGLLIAAGYAGHVANGQLRGLRRDSEDQRKTEGRRRAFDHLAQLFDGDFIRMQTEAQRLFTARPTPTTPAAWEALWKQKSSAERFRITATMNFYEVVAGEYNDPRGELLDRATADKALSYIADGMWDQAQPFVYWLRDFFKNERAYAEWEQLHRTFSQRQELTAASTTAPAESPSLPATAQMTPAPEPASHPAGAGPAVAQAPPAPQPAGAGPAVVGAPPAQQNDCPPDPCVLMPRSVLAVAILWTVAIIGTFFAYIEIEAVADFFPPKIGPLPVSAIWFGAVGGLLVSLEGIFRYNRRWRRSYDYWHYLRPLLGAVMGTLGCLVFIVLTAAAASSSTPEPDAAFYAVVALALGYREASFRALLTRLIDTVIVPAEKEKEKPGATGTTP